ncbi:MAG: dihydrofolate reductase family protein, partial [Actinomycetota bacterium]|nr:dihydrofolate reductase family protein [Actinomycetota bacterium]
GFAATSRHRFSLPEGTRPATPFSHTYPYEKGEAGKRLFVGGVTLPLALAELGLIDEYEFVVPPRLAGHGPTLFAGLSERIDLKLVSRLEFGSGAVAMRYEPRR